MRTWIISSTLLALFCGTICYATGIPQTLNYQGSLQTNTGQPVNVPTDITFSLYTTPLGTETPFWSETIPNVPVSNGQFSVTLGGTTPIDSAKFTGTTYIGIKVGTQPEMTPRQKMTSVSYSFKAGEAQTAISAQTAAFATTATGVVPKGGIIMWSGTTVPAGWALCDGSNGTPNLRERFIVGASSNYLIGSFGGEAKHFLTVDEMPPHNHAVANYRMPLFDGTQTSNGQQLDNIGIEPHLIGNSGSDPAIVGSGNAHNNLPPYYALAFIMKL